jgi:hypothetical protein
MKDFIRGLKQLALIAMIVRALMPVGWMPSAGVDTPFVVCTMNGPVQQAPDRDKLPAGHHDICPFAAAPHLAAVPELPQIVLPQIHAGAAQAERAYAAMQPARFSPASPRAPPLNA